MPAFFTMYLLAAMRAASRASEEMFSFSQLQGSKQGNNGQGKACKQVHNADQRQMRTPFAAAASIQKCLKVIGIQGTHLTRCTQWGKKSTPALLAPTS